MNKIYTLIFLVLLIMVMPVTNYAQKPSIGSLLDFGGHQWRVLVVKDSTALIISELILEQREYHGSFEDITWEKCSLRSYLNDEYYDSKFTIEEKARILETRNSNLPNPRYGTDGGVETIDKIFLLSLDEVVKYFGDSGDLKKGKGPVLNDKYSRARITREVDGEEWLWWLRSPGDNPVQAAFVGENGVLFISGGGVAFDKSGIRPAMWIKI